MLKVIVLFVMISTVMSMDVYSYANITVFNHAWEKQYNFSRIDSVELEAYATRANYSLSFACYHGVVVEYSEISSCPEHCNITRVIPRFVNQCIVRVFPWDFLGDEEGPLFLSNLTVKFEGKFSPPSRSDYFTPNGHTGGIVPSPPAPPPPQPPSNKGLSVGAYVGIAISVLICCVAIAAALYFILRLKDQGVFSRN